MLIRAARRAGFHVRLQSDSEDGCVFFLGVSFGEIGWHRRVGPRCGGWGCSGSVVGGFKILILIK